jgi:hypothetical protein
MDLILLFWLSGDPVMGSGPIPGGPEACAALKAEILAQIAGSGPEDLFPYGDGSVPFSALSVSCEPPPSETCPIPEGLPDLLI